MKNEHKSGEKPMPEAIEPEEKQNLVEISQDEQSKTAPETLLKQQNETEKGVKISTGTWVAIILIFGTLFGGSAYLLLSTPDTGISSELGEVPHSPPPPPPPPENSLSTSTNNFSSPLSHLSPEKPDSATSSVLKENNKEKNK